MTIRNLSMSAVSAILVASLLPSPASAHGLREMGETVEVADSNMAVTPSRDWNRLSGNIGRRTETWTLDGGQLNDVTFYGGIEIGDPLVREQNRRQEPLPKFTETTLLIEIPELLEGTYRTYKSIGTFETLSAEPIRFLGHSGVLFTYEYTDVDELTRKGEARASIIDGELYMVTFDAPRLHYFEQVIGDFRALADSSRLE
ncbi:MAG: hypothetical protein V4647_11615 [Pseudomonadota bacterium]